MGTLPAKSFFVAHQQEAFEAMESLSAPESMDLASYAYDAPWKGDEDGEDALAVFDEGEQSAEFDGQFDAFGDDTDDDDLFAALDQALDEIEHEQRVEAVKAIATPENDALELGPVPETVYRDALKNFLAQPMRHRAPRYSEVAVRTPVQSPALGSLLADGIRRARLSVEQRKAVGKITNPELRSALTY